MATDNIATLGIKVDPKGAISGASKAKRAIGRIGKAADRVKNKIFSLNGAMGALGAGMAFKSALKYAASIESLQVQLKFLTGNTRDAGKAFEYMLKFAKSAPFSLQQIQKASPSLLTVADNVDELNALMEITGDIASSSVLDFQQVAQQLQKTFSGGIAAADQFRDAGIKSLLGFETGVKYTAEESKKHIMDMWKNSATSLKGATKDMAKTFEGQVSMMGDAWDELQLAFMKEGIFDKTKSSVQELTEWLRSPATLRGAKSLANSVLSIGRAMRNAFNSYTSMPSWVQKVGLVMAFLGGMKARLVLAGLVALSEGIDAVRDALIGASKAGKIKVDIIGNAEASVEEKLKKVKNIQGKIDDILSGKTKVAGGSKGAERWLASYRATIASLTKDMVGLNEIIGGTSVPTDDKVETNAIDGQSGKQRAAVAAFSSSLSKSSQALKNYGVRLSPVQKLQKQFRDSVISINEAIVKNPELISHQASAMKELEGAYLDAVNRMEDEKIKNIVANLASSMETSITDMIMNIGNGANSLKDTVKDMARAILAEFIKIQVARPAAQFLAGMTSSLFSFDGGGYTGSGSRSGGIDGKGGFQAVLHPNETVVDHTKGQSVSQGGSTNVSVSFNITANDTQGFDDLLDSRRGMIVGIINQAMNDRGMTGVTA